MKTSSAVLGAVIMSALAACSAGSARTVVPAGVAAGTTAWTTHGRFAAPTAALPLPDLRTYQPELVPVGAEITLVTKRSGAGASLTVTLAGVIPNRLYTAHVHTGACGADPSGSGPHYQEEKDSHQPSVDPAFANPANEVWLDLVTDGDGRGTATVTTAWFFRKGEANSLVLHAAKTHTEPGMAGKAGARIACVTEQFGR
ncbi:superoxide dismutase family protein [Amycolatopsis mongoliensis]|uniref:Superoxide dismutase family protein n=1 Tax=Amycolatopsis mongoliensis TaxID=715475 RepID=A0A9Y2NHG2_9PSEU|nr:superoxide dismutase family protein [Amycolatopsis sp. 4-36]WIX98169.1 superoxide dismutase family protein [Amycolatopsis sp. 4-36]